MRCGAGTRPRGAGRRGPRPTLPVRLLIGLLVLEVVAFLVSTIPGVRSEPASTRCSTAGCRAPGTSRPRSWPRPARSPPPSTAPIWAWLAAGLAARALGFVLFLSYVRQQHPLPYPSVADVAWLAMYVLMFAGLVELARRRARRLSTSLVLDAAGRDPGGLRAGRRAALPDRPVPGRAGHAELGGRRQPGLSRAGPALLVVFIGVLLAYEFRPPPAAWVLAAGVVGLRGRRRDLRLPVRGRDLPSRHDALLGLPRRHGAGRRRPAGSPARPAPAAANRCPSVVLPGPVRPGLPGAARRRHPAADPRPRRRPRRDRRRRRDRPHRPGVPGRPLAGRAPAGGPHGRADRAGEPAGVQRDPRPGDGPPRPTTAAWRCWSSTSTTSRPSTTPWATTTGTSCSGWPLRGSSRRSRSGDVVARIGGDEFAVLLADADSALAVRIAERLRAGFRRPVPPRPALVGHRPERRDRAGARRRQRPGRAAPARRPGDVRGEGHPERAGPVQPPAAPLGAEAAGDHRAAAAGAARRRDRRALPAAWSRSAPAR